MHSVLNNSLTKDIFWNNTLFDREFLEVLLAEDRVGDHNSFICNVVTEVMEVFRKSVHIN